MVCPEWSDFQTFHAWAMSNGYKEGLTIDRIDNDKGYSPDNCRWVTRSENAHKGNVGRWERYRTDLQQRCSNGN
jgi:hypothetical protein